MVDKAYFSWREEDFAVDILIGGEDDPESVEIGDAIITLPTGDRYRALMMTVEEILRVMDNHAASGESLGGTYFCTPGLIVMRDKGVAAMIDVVRDIVHSEYSVPKIDKNGDLCIPKMW